MAGEAGQAGGRLHAGQRHRRDGPHVRAEIRRGLGPAGDRRQCHRQLGRDRRRQGREIGARWLYADVVGQCRHHGAAGAPAGAVRSAQGLCADLHHAFDAERDRGQQRPAGQVAGRADRLRQGQSRQALVRHAGHRHAAARGGRAVLPSGRHQDGAHSLSWRQLQRHAGWCRAGRDPECRRHHAAGARWPPARPRGDRAQALGRYVEPADRRRVRASRASRRGRGSRCSRQPARRSRFWTRYEPRR